MGRDREAVGDVICPTVFFGWLMEKEANLHFLLEVSPGSDASTTHNRIGWRNTVVLPRSLGRTKRHEKRFVARMGEVFSAEEQFFLTHVKIVRYLNNFNSKL
ncbi:hypothetical protein HNY73_009624 [Argiope bruennichi]|uniref:Uncharacterized protein n=1 Tax=Argiope bruennichi TaxID=94029 RepID=A0A8T0FF88_ARGBR|nr:hypothetical protein HNY73_009624 [Argiope bruennichi]